MEHNRSYIEELIGKLLHDQLTPEEVAALEQEKKKYTTAEYERLVMNVLMRMEGKLPENAWTEWQPDLAKIRREGDRRRAAKSGGHASIWWAAALGILIPTIMYVVYVESRRPEMPDLSYGACAEMDSDAEFPVSESGFVLRYGEGTQQRIYPDNGGELARVGGLVLIREPDGVLRLAYDDHVQATDGQGDYVDITTERMQQCLVELPDGTRIRLNARSLLRYPTAQVDIPVATLIGEARVQSSKGNPVLIRTGNAVLSTMGADFLVLTNPFYTRAILEKGAVKLHRGRSEDRVRIRSTREEVVWGRVVSNDQPPRYQVAHTRAADLNVAKRWTKAVRHYRDVPLRQYYQEMARWYGLRVKDIRCLPIDRRVNTVSCYRDDYQRVLLAIRSSGVSVVETKGMLSFCEEEEK